MAKVIGDGPSCTVRRQIAVILQEGRLVKNLESVLKNFDLVIKARGIYAKDVEIFHKDL